METESWFIWRDTAHSPYLNMGIDELLLQESAALPGVLLRFYDWDRPSVSIGYVQEYRAAPFRTHTVVRRPTGGGIVYHDDDLTYTAIIPAGHPVTRLNRLESYHLFHRAVQQLLAGFGLSAELAGTGQPAFDRATMQCFTTPTRYDVVAAGQKYAGAAQRRTRDGILHQGSIARTGKRLAEVNREELIEKFLTALQNQLAISFKTFTVSKGFLERAESLAAQKYESTGWNRHKQL